MLLLVNFLKFRRLVLNLVQMGGTLMNWWKMTSILWLVLFIVGATFLWLRKTDATGAINTPAYQMTSLAIWCVLFGFILFIQLIWLVIMRVRHRK